MADEEIWPAGQWPGAIEYEPGPAANVPDPGFDVWAAWNAGNQYSQSAATDQKLTREFISGQLGQDEFTEAMHKGSSYEGAPSAPADGDGSDD